MTYFGSGPMGKRHKPTEPKAGAAPLGAVVQATNDGGREASRDQLQRPASVENGGSN